MKQLKKAFIFPGQGSQYVGMGEDLYQNYSLAKEIYDRAESLLDFSVKEISFNGPEELLRQTQYTQPAIFVHSMAIQSILNKNGWQPQATAGHSLGEYSALVAAGALRFEEGLKLVVLRGELMQHSGEKNPGTMAAVIGLSREVVARICEEASSAGLVKMANFNSPGQIVISGSIPGVRRAMELAREQKARMVTQLPVSGAFHSPLMKEALSGLEDALNSAPIRDADLPVYTNVTAKPVRRAAEIREMLKQQLLSPVRWESIIKNMVADGIEHLFEVGPSKVLCGLNRRIQRETGCTPVGRVPDIEAIIAEEE